ncbi:MAG: competence/damage-inducible protein A [Bryobacteraceae bacterium]
MADAEIIAVGSELLTPQKLDTNSLYLTDQLNALGVEVVRKTIVGDERDRLTDSIRGAAARSQIVIVTGGLGPTEDDVTRDSVAAALGRELIFHQEICDWLVQRFRSFGRTMTENNKRQAYLVDGAEILPNQWGSAPGQWITHEGATLILLPGPPRELKALFPAECLPRLEKLLPAQVIRTRFYRVAGLGESDLDALIAPVYTRYQNPVTTILASAGDIQIHLRARCATAQEAEALLVEVSAQLEPLLADRLYSTDGTSLEQVIGKMLLSQKAFLCVAESATGGLLGERITTVAGCGEYFLGGFLTYTDQMKNKLLGVPMDMIERHTAVSEPVVKAMAEGARRNTGADYALAISGYAGPDGEQVGLVYVGIASRDGAEARRFQFPGDRNRVRSLASNYALDLLRRKLSAANAGTS